MLTKQRVRVNVLTALVAAFTLVALFGTHTFAATTPDAARVTPVRSDIQITPGASKVVQVSVVNPTNTTLYLSPIENDFIAGDEKGTPALILNADQYAPTHSLKRFMAPLKNITVAPNDTTIVNVTITVPKTAQSGGYFGAVRFAPSSSVTGGQVNLSSSLASIILLTVPGPTTEQLNLTNFEVQQKGKTGTLFHTPDNLTALIRFENKGNIQEAPFGQLEVKDGKKTVYTYDFNQSETAPKDEILPDSARRWSVPIKNLKKFGHYTISGTLAYGAKNETVNVSQSFWIIPYWMIYSALGLLVLIVAAIVAIILVVTRRNRRRGGGYKPRVSRGSFGKKEPENVRHY